MRRFILPFAAACALTAFSVVTSFSQDAAVKAGDLTLSGGWLRAMLPGQPAGGGYVVITNAGGSADRLVSVSTAAAGKSELHMMEMKNDVMVMRPVEGGIEIPAGATVELKPGSLHLMFVQVKQPFKEGSTVPVTLEFEKAGKVELAMPVKAASGGQQGSNDAAGSHMSTAADDQGQIIHLMKGQFETATAPLAVEPVVVVGDHAVAGWTQEGRGGRAFLTRKHGGWRIHLCAGESLKSAENLVKLGLEPTAAATMAEQIASSEKALGAERIALFDSFEGTMMVDQDGAHGAQGTHGG